jgi:hypothetical protein
LLRLFAAMAFLLVSVLLERLDQAILDVIDNPKRLKKLPVSER